MTTTSQRYSRSLAATALVGLVLPVTTAAPAGADEAPYTGFSTESTATPVRVEIYEPTIPIPASPQAEVEVGYTRVEADTGSSRGRASYLWPGDSLGEGAKTVFENLGLPPEISGPIAAQGYPFQVNSTSPTGEDSQADEPFPGMVMRTKASPEKTTAASGYSTDCQAEEPESDGGGGGDAPAPPTLPLLESLSLPGLGGAGSSSEDQATESTKDARGEDTKNGKQAEEPAESCKIPADLAALVDFGGYVSTSASANDGSTVAATSRSALSDVELLGGVITVSGVHATSTAASDGSKGDPGGKAGYGTLAIAGQEFSIGPDGVEGGDQSQKIPGLPDDPKKALKQLGVRIIVPEPTFERDGDKAVSSVAALVVELDTRQLRSMLDAVPFDEIVDQVPDETGQLKSLLGAAVNLSPKFVITLGDARTVVDTVQGIEIPTTTPPPPAGGGEGNGSGGAASSGGTGGGAGAPDVPTAFPER